MIRKLGIDPPPIANGFLEDNYEYFEKVYPEFTILYGAGKIHHLEAEEATIWVWRPNKENFFKHDKDGRFIYVGGGRIARVKPFDVRQRVEEVLSNLYPDRINSLSIPLVPMRMLREPIGRNIIRDIDAILTELDRLRDEGKIRYASIEEVAKAFLEKERTLNFDFSGCDSFFESFGTRACAG